MKAINIWLLLAIVAIPQILLTSCSVESLDSNSVALVDPNFVESFDSNGEVFSCDSVSSVTSFRDDFEAGQSWPHSLNTNGKWGYEIDPQYGEPKDANGDPVTVSPIVIDSTFPRAGNSAVKFTVNPGDVVANGNRAELKHRPVDRDLICTEAWYAWSIYIPVDYLPPSSNDGFQIVGQFHGTDAPPPLSFELRQANHIRNADDYDKIVFKHNVGEDGQVSGEVIAEQQVTFGEWLDIIIHVKWSDANDGFVETWFRSVPDPYNVTTNYEPVVFTSTGSTRFIGPTMFNKDPNYLKIGLYRNEAIADFSDTIGILYYDEIRRGNSFEEVALD